MSYENEYLKFLEYVLHNGTIRNHSDTYSISVFGTQTIYNIEMFFPLLTTKKMNFNNILVEFLWFIFGGKNHDDFLHKHNIHISTGSKGSSSSMCRHWEDTNGYQIDQLQNLSTQLMKNPYSRRHILNLWNSGYVYHTKEFPSTVLIQFFVSNNKTLSSHIYQRSSDIFNYSPIDIAIYALLTYVLAHLCKYKVSTLIHTIGDAHIYRTDIEQIEKQLHTPIKDTKVKLQIDSTKNSIDDFLYQDFVLI